MAAKNTVKQFVPGAYYHIYNRGVEKRVIFMDSQDYGVFLSYLKVYLLPKDTKRLQLALADRGTPWQEKDRILKLLHLNNFADSLSLLSYCLMPNHFHFLVHQKELDTIDRFMNSLGTRYATYFNHKYKRVGSLFQGLYKAVLVTTDEQLLNLTRYIHRNPISILQESVLQKYSYSSYGEYLRERETEWLKSSGILAFFRSTDQLSYRSFVEDAAQEAQSLDKVKELALDLDDSL